MIFLLLQNQSENITRKEESKKPRKDIGIWAEMPLFLMHLENRIVAVVCGFYWIPID